MNLNEYLQTSLKKQELPYVDQEAFPWEAFLNQKELLKYGSVSDMYILVYCEDKDQINDFSQAAQKEGVENYQIIRQLSGSRLPVSLSCRKLGTKSYLVYGPGCSGRNDYDSHVSWWTESFPKQNFRMHRWKDYMTRREDEARTIS